MKDDEPRLRAIGGLRVIQEFEPGGFLHQG